MPKKEKKDLLTLCIEAVTVLAAELTGGLGEDGLDTTEWSKKQRDAYFAALRACRKLARS